MLRRRTRAATLDLTYSLYDNCDDSCCPSNAAYTSICSRSCLVTASARSWAVWGSGSRGGGGGVLAGNGVSHGVTKKQIVADFPAMVRSDGDFAALGTARHRHSALSRLSAQAHPCPQLGAVILRIGAGEYFGLEVGWHQASSDRLF
jgi:hypothetical protein